MRLIQDFSTSALTAGFVAALVGFTSSIAIVFEAARAMGASPQVMASWMWSLGMGMGLIAVVLSWLWRKPVMIAWSTAGAAVLASTATSTHFSLAEGAAAFMVSASLITLFGITGWFERLMNRIPQSLASALLAGVLARFGMGAFSSAQTDLVLVLVMFSAYLITRRFSARYAVPVTLLVSMVYVAFNRGFAPGGFTLSLAMPVWTTPEFSIAAIVGMALPLFIVTMASQNMPGVAAIKACGYGDERANGGDAGIPISRTITITGLANLALAPFGGFALNLSAITAAICMEPHVHPDKDRRYIAAMTHGGIFILIAILGGTFVSILNAFPREMVSAIAGLALLGTIANALYMALRDVAQREAAIITFLVTVSGVVIAGVGSAFWGVVAGAVAMLVQYAGRTASMPHTHN